MGMEIEYIAAVEFKAFSFVFFVSLFSCYHGVLAL